MTPEAKTTDRAPAAEFRSVSAETGEPEGAPFAVDGLAEVDSACAAAEAAFDSYRATTREARAAFLERIGQEILALGDDLIVAAMRESGLPRARLEGERGRTVGQLNLFANVVRSGGWQQLRLDSALPDRTPPKPDLRLRMIPLGPVAVFGASNFPLAFSTAGGDTASALAAGCPVVVKGHPAHPQTGALVAQAIHAAVAACGLPAGVFSHLVGPGNDLGAALVQNPHISAVGFTGSRGGGLALVKLAQARPVPIPVYAEMSSINPVLLLPEALKSRAASLGQAYAASLTMGAGQFCTNPGLVLVIDGEGVDAFAQAAAEAIGQAPSQTMLTTGIQAAYEKGAKALATHSNVATLACGQGGNGHTRGQAFLFETTADAFLADAALGHEVFGAASLIVRCKTEGELQRVLHGLEGQLTATLHMDAADLPAARALLPVLERKAGRVLVNGFPTGVEVCDAMVHGGPYPASTNFGATSVGTMSIRRFLRPVSYQNLPPDLIPADLA